DADCASISNPRFMYSGNPVTQNGWINIRDIDQKQLSSTGPFNLVKGERSPLAELASNLL
ncbi:MAG: hypothetical protein L3J54_07350, partial [Draconibacterium sp.]|nr:hypothetical protein [Draconibacterium sp.]